MAHETGSPGAGRDPLDPKKPKTKGYVGKHRKGGTIRIGNPPTKDPKKK